MGYYTNLEKFSLDMYKEKLRKAYLPPSRMILKDKLDERFGFFKSMGIGNVKQLLQLLKQKKKHVELTRIECLSDDYLKVLLRELNSICPKPVKLADFPRVSKGTISKLEKSGLHNTAQLYDQITSSEKRKKLAYSLQIDENEILELAKLTDLSRIKWVGATAARMLYDVGIDTAEKISKADYYELHKKINQHNKEQNIYNGHIGVNDIKIMIDAAKEVPIEIEYYPY